MLLDLNNSISMKMVLTFYETGVEYPYKWCYISEIYNYKQE